MNLDYPLGATPLDPDEKQHLIPPDISTQDQLNQAEQHNILEAELWLLGRKQEILSESLLRKVHKRMFQLVWRWAGQYRKSEKNLGVPSYSIPEEINKLLADTRYWIEHKTYSWTELGTRFHHRLVSIHPFPNGNGRHSRLLTDALLIQHDQKRFTWGSNLEGNLSNTSVMRQQYIHALRSADNRDFKELIQFVQS